MAQEYAKTIHAETLEVSAKDDTNIKELFESIASKIHKKAEDQNQKELTERQ